jgi:hypothetical protein
MKMITLFGDEALCQLKRVSETYKAVGMLCFELARGIQLVKCS